MSKAICTRVTQESLPDILKQLENETSVLWCRPNRRKPTVYAPPIKPYEKFTLQFGVSGWEGLSVGGWPPRLQMVPPKRFIMAVKKECPK